MRTAHGKRKPIGLNWRRLIGARCIRLPGLHAAVGCVKGTPTADWTSRKTPSES